MGECSVDKDAIAQYYYKKSKFSLIPFIGDSIGDAATTKPPDHQSDLSNVQTSIQTTQTTLDTLLAKLTSKIVTDFRNTLVLLVGTETSPGYIQVTEQVLTESLSEKISLISVQLIALIIVVLVIIFAGI